MSPTHAKINEGSPLAAQERALPLQAHERLVSAERARALLQAGLAEVIDARDQAAELWLGHIPGAVHLPWRALTRARRSGELVPDEELFKRLEALGVHPECPVLVYAGWASGWGEEARALWTLEYAGLERVAVIAGGWSAWRKAGGERAFGSPAERLKERPTSTPSPSLTAGAARWRARPELRALTSELPKLLTLGAQPIDTRSTQEFEGETPYGSPVGGHLEGALHLPWEALITADGLRAQEELRELLQHKGVRLERPLVVYCTGGVRSAMAYLALRQLGAKDVRNYDGSWWAWSERLRGEGATEGSQSAEELKRP